MCLQVGVGQGSRVKWGICDGAQGFSPYREAELFPENCCMSMLVFITVNHTCISDTAKRAEKHCGASFSFLSWFGQVPSTCWQVQRRQNRAACWSPHRVWWCHGQTRLASSCPRLCARDAYDKKWKNERVENSKRVIPTHKISRFLNQYYSETQTPRITKIRGIMIHPVTHFSNQIKKTWKKAN